MVKRIFSLIVVIIAICCSACSPLTPQAFVAESLTVASSEEMPSRISSFMGLNGSERADRTAFTQNETRAANYIMDELLSYGYDEENAYMHSFSLNSGGSTPSGTTQTVIKSQNVVASYNGQKDKFVVVSAHYDNAYSDVLTTGAYGNGSHGVADNVTGVCALLSLAQAFITNKPQIDFGIKFVFFGASEVGYVGSKKFLDDFVDDPSSILLAINLECISSNKIYVYADESETKQENCFLLSTHGQTEFLKLSKTVPVMDTQYVSNLPYSHYGFWSDSSTFYSAGIPTVNLLGYDLDNFSYYSYTKDDLYSFTSENAYYATAMSDTVNSVYSMLIAKDFLTEANSFEKPTEKISFWIKNAWAVLTHVALVIVLLIVLLFVVKHLRNKYPETLQRAKKVKIAIFGSDYENNADSEIIVDIEKIGLDPFGDNKTKDKNEKK